MPVAAYGLPGGDVRGSLTRKGVIDLMRELARTAPRRGTYRVYFVGGATAVLHGWRVSTIDADLYAGKDAIFHDIQNIKERLQLNIEFARPEDFVPALAGSDDRHVFIETIRNVSFYHYDPYAQLLSKVVRGFNRDLQDARSFVDSGLVDPGEFRVLVGEISDAAYSKYPSLSGRAVRDAVENFLS